MSCGKRGVMAQMAERRLCNLGFQLFMDNTHCFYRMEYWRNGTRCRVTFLVIWIIIYSVLWIRYSYPARLKASVIYNFSMTMDCYLNFV